MDSNDAAHPFGLSVKRRLTQKAPYKLSGHSASDVQPRQAISRMGPVRTVEITIQTEESRIGKAVQGRKQILVLRSRRRDLDADDTEMDPPATQQLLLAGGKIFVEHQH